MSSDKGSSKADTLVKVVLVFFISLLSFSVGTFVGKQVSDSDHRRMALEGETKAERGVASTEGAKEATENGEKISEKEVENLTEEFVNKEKATVTSDDDADKADKTEAAPANDEQSAKDDKTETNGYKSYDRGAKSAQNEKTEKNVKAKAEKADATHKAAEKVANDEAPSDGAAEPRKPASTLPSVASSAVGKYTVQVSSYTDENEAKTRAADLKGKGWNAFYFPANVNGRTWYRVSVGLFSSAKSAGEFRAQFMKEANTKSALVQKIIQ